MAFSVKRNAQLRIQAHKHARKILQLWSSIFVILSYFLFFFMTFHLVQRGGAVRIGPCWTTQWRERSKAAWVWSERSGDGGGGSSSVRTAAERGGVKGWPGKGGGACCWLAGWVTGWVVQLWTYSCPDSLSPAPSVCSKRGLLQAKVGPVDWQPLTGLSGRIQTKPAEEGKKYLG